MLRYQGLLVPCVDASPRREAPGDRHSLLLAPTDSASGAVSGERGQCMARTEDTGEHFHMVSLEKSLRDGNPCEGHRREHGVYVRWRQRRGFCRPTVTGNGRCPLSLGSTGHRRGRVLIVLTVIDKSSVACCSLIRDFPE